MVPVTVQHALPWSGYAGQLSRRSSGQFFISQHLTSARVAVMAATLRLLPNTSRLRWLTITPISSAWPVSRSAAPAALAASAASDWVTWSISLAALAISSMPRLCCRLASVMAAVLSPMRVALLTISSKSSFTCFSDSALVVTCRTVLSRSTWVFLAASAARLARFFTSSATTANPAPASPARAASTAAFRARRLVWKAMESMVVIIFLILPLSSSIRLMLRVSSTRALSDWPER